jgi:lysosomal Pro-X carboxypeptidase
VHLESSSEGCDDPIGLYGYPSVSDPWGEWLNLYYGGLRIGSHSNIVFSNGLLDPWSAGGVYKSGMNPTVGGYKGPVIQNLTSDGSMIALIIRFGGHHTDLMYSNPNDPQCVKDARRL